MQPQHTIAIFVALEMGDETGAVGTNNPSRLWKAKEL